jgi:hypothetical protein
MHSKLLIDVLVAALLAAPLAAGAQSFRCTGKDGRQYYGSMIPAPCVGQPVEQLNTQGMVIKRLHPEDDGKAREAQEAKETRKREARDSRRRDLALLATYASQAEIEAARQRALQDNRDARSFIEEHIESIRRRRNEYQAEAETYQADDEAPPAGLAEDIHRIEARLHAQERALQGRLREADEINDRFDEYRKRYAELTGRR